MALKGSLRSYPFNNINNIIMNKLDELKKAKENVISCLENENVNIDFHGLTYWSRVVESLREEIKCLM